MDPAQTEIDLHLTLAYRPHSGIVTIEDQWQPRGAGPATFALIASHNIDRAGREPVYRDIKHVIATYFDVLAARWSEHP